ncbi:hypothetical protein [Arthrobacter sp. H35-D1]|uniref:hypothetical protein n=1 Tax=Arthrobacter sp. H35-D1 TaxID=3046202 RepID=UPI0024B96162|nr:hypothetical protein [Arthrobacter sp. H35-D1]MDJ0314067.1 hypothetical protein [Arthrobacter sp. H35-D1]
MGIDGWIDVLAVLVVALTAGTLLAGTLLLRVMAGVRVWNAYLSAVFVALSVLMWAGLKMNRLWDAAGNPREGDVPFSDVEEVPIAFWLNAPFGAVLVVFTGGMLLWLLGRTAAKDRAALSRSPLATGQMVVTPTG